MGVYRGEDGCVVDSWGLFVTWTDIYYVLSMGMRFLLNEGNIKGWVKLRSPDET